MVTYTVAFVTACVLALVLTPLLCGLAHRFELYDDAAEARKVHRGSIPRIGGLAIAVGFFVPVLGLYFVDNAVSEATFADPLRVIGLILGSLIVIGLGLTDDLRGVGAKKKFAVQVVVATIAYGLGYQIAEVANPFGDPVSLGLLSYPITLLWIVGVMNAINLIDGLDGLAGGVGLFTVLTLFVVALVNGNPLVGLTSIALAGALVGFLRYNFNPASIFMGDSGSLFLGYVLAVTAISGSHKSSTVVSLLIPVLALGLPLLDTSVSIFRRFISGRPIFSADRGHIHHRLLDLGLGHRQVVLVLYALCGVGALGALGLVYAQSDTQVVMILGVIGIAAFALSRSLGYLHWETVSASVRYGLLRQQKLRVHLEILRDTIQEMKRAPDMEHLLGLVEDLAGKVGIDRVVVQLAVTRRDEGMHRYRLAWPEDGAAEDLSRAVRLLEHPLDWEAGEVEITGWVSFGWNCSEEILQVPESPCYQLLAVVLRDRALELARADRRLLLGPRLARS